jgi:hypothetical protein
MGRLMAATAAIAEARSWKRAFMRTFYLARAFK